MSASSDSARTNRKNVAAMCEKCHVDDPAVRDKDGTIRSIHLQL